MIATTHRLVQLSDLHLFASAHGRLLGQNTQQTFAAVRAQVQSRHPDAAAYLITGDLMHDEGLTGYRYLQRDLQGIGVRCYCLPGNHDRVDLLATLIDPHNPKYLRVEAVGGWELILLDSTIPGEDGGWLAAHDLAALDAYLSNQRERPVLVAMHHHPLAAGSRWLDQMIIRNAPDLLAILDRYPQVSALVWGHIHQQFDGQRGHYALLATPSTCIQFLPASPEFAIDTLTPGYRWIDLYADGTINSGVERIAAYPDPLELMALGY